MQERAFFVLLVQEGVCPQAQKDISRFPFFQMNYTDQETMLLHFAFTNLSRFDVRLSTEDKRPQDFLLRADKLPIYGASYMHIF